LFSKGIFNNSNNLIIIYGNLVVTLVKKGKIPSGKIIFNFRANWYCFSVLFFYLVSRDNVLDLGLLVELLFTNSISAFFAVDFLVSCIVFLVFMFNESRKYNIKEKWICLLTLFTVGLSLALPLFLFFRHSYINSKDEV